MDREILRGVSPERSAWAQGDNFEGCHSERSEGSPVTCRNSLLQGYLQVAPVREREHGDRKGRHYHTRPQGIIVETKVFH